MKPLRKKLFAAIVCILLAVAAVVFLFHLKPTLQIRQLDARYQQVQVDDDISTVTEIMGREPEWHDRSLHGGWWNGAQLSSNETARIRQSARYTVRTFYLPVTFEFAFDETGACVGKHRFD